jgi:hypothetical protein
MQAVAVVVRKWAAVTLVARAVAALVGHQITLALAALQTRAAVQAVAALQERQPVTVPALMAVRAL